MDEDERLNAITGKVIAAAIRVHRALGPGLLESGCRVGLLINFNVTVLKDRIRRIVNDFPDSLRSPRPLR